MTTQAFDKELRSKKEAHKVIHQESKEFQMKVNWAAVLGKAKPKLELTDIQLFDAVVQILNDVVDNLSQTGKRRATCINNIWWREGIRYDSKEKIFLANNLTLAIEATDKLTKLKCKKHSFVPELLFRKTRKSICYPNISSCNPKSMHIVRHKLEQDMHFSNHKYCASGSLFIPGRQTQVETLDFFVKYFPKLRKLSDPSTPLFEVSHWDEAIFDDMTVAWDSASFSTWMLVNRWDWKNKTLIESELSFKVEKDIKEKWDFEELDNANKLYLALCETGFFLPMPPIFLYQSPASSIGIKVA